MCGSVNIKSDAPIEGSYQVIDGVDSSVSDFDNDFIFRRSGRGSWSNLRSCVLCKNPRSFVASDCRHVHEMLER